MGLFSKIKENLSHGGVNISLQAPASASLEAASIPLSVSVTAKDAPHTINSVKVELVRTNNNLLHNDTASSADVYKTIAVATDMTQFSLQAGETKTITLNLVLNTGAAVKAELPDNPALQQFAGAMQKLQSVSDSLNSNSYTYELNAIVDVEGIALDPSYGQPIQLLKPGQVGSGLNLNVHL